MDDNKPDLLAVAPQLTPDDARSLLSSFTHSQVLSIVQSAALRHPDVLSAFRMNGHPRPDRVSPLLSISLPPLINPRPLVIRCSRGIREDFCPSISAGWISGYCGLKVVFAGVLLVSSSAPFDIVDFCVFRRRRRLRLDFSIQSLGLFSVQVRASVEREREMMYYQFPKFSHQDSLKILDADIQHANSLASAIPSAKCGACLQMKLGYNHLAPILLYLLQWMDCSCTCLLARYLNLSHVLVYKRLYCHLFSGSMASWSSGMIVMRKILTWRLLERSGPNAVKGFPVLIWREKMNVGFAWSPAPKWFCPTAVMKCVSTANVIDIIPVIIGLLKNAQVAERYNTDEVLMQKSGQYEATLQLLSSFTVSLLNLRRDDGSHGLSLSHPLGSSGIVLHDSQGLSLQPHDLITDRVHSLSHHRAGAGDRSTTDHCRRHLSFTTTGALTGAAPQAIDFLAWSQCQTLSTGGFGSIVEREEFPEDFNKYLRTELNWSQLENAVDETHIAGWVFWCRGDNRPPHAPQCSILCALLCLVVGRERASPFRLWWLVVVVDCARVGFWLVLAGLWWWSFIECIAASVDVEVVLMAVWTGGDIVKG
ncbi:hypothetical protein RHGRI_007938 [Rhododendron griersonianum]|uniref:Uncharacterized protein n=1 Tax=Rhododendron griersonianum TaxID=479676 RepID=A0AAV6L020_9ERIC|nr:hypothetical protein RHGRI_007938 [Rhododendron griersonianum]